MNPSGAISPRVHMEEKEIHNIVHSLKEHGEAKCLVR